jgi:uracil-DNA glycosylase family 4
MNEQDAADAGPARLAVIQRLESLRRAGILQLGKPRREARPTVTSQEKPTSAVVNDVPARGESAEPRSPSPSTKPPSPSPKIEQEVQNDMRRSTSNEDRPRAASSPLIAESAFTGPALPLEERKVALQVIQKEVAACTRCSLLAKTRTQTVFGVGNPQARLCFLGEAPGADEDRQGEPFVGRAGQLLNDIITKGMGLRREDVYILNILKCRPPGNRNPEPEEAENCRGFLQRQLEVIRPEYICCLGAVAVTNLLHTTDPIGRMRGRFYDFRGIKVLATYHPAYLLRNPSAKRLVWDDVQLLMNEMGLKIPAKPTE